MKGYKVNIENETKANETFRTVAYTGAYLQLVYMTLQPGESIGAERHGNDQFFRVEQGSGVAVIDDNEYQLSSDDGIIVPAGAKHNVTNNGQEKLKLYTIYAGPHHMDAKVHQTKADAEVDDDDEFDGQTSE